MALTCVIPRLDLDEVGL
jgi:hypothetical protein